MEISGLYDRGYLVNFEEGDQALFRTPIKYVFGIGDDFYTIKYSDTLLSIAQEKYGDQSYWYLIADANESIVDIFDLTPNDTIVIPSLSIINSIYG